MSNKCNDCEMKDFCKSFRADFKCTHPLFRDKKELGIEPKTQWEYKIMKLDGLGLETEHKMFHNLGAKGWELVTCYGSRAYFKREIQNG